MKFYTLTDLHEAQFILNNNTVDRFGTMLYNQKWVTWASKVVAWFFRFYSKAKRYFTSLKFWDLSIKAVWNEIKARRKALANKLKKQAAKIDLDVFRGVTMKIRGKGAASTRTRRKVERIINLAVNGISTIGIPKFVGDL